ncbi:hypothetical protein D3C75_900540 [compost metagenome]
MMPFPPELLDRLVQGTDRIVGQHVHDLAAMDKAEIQEVQQQHFFIRNVRPEAEPHQLLRLGRDLQRDGAQHAVRFDAVRLDPFGLQQQALNVSVRVDGQRSFLPLIALEHAAQQAFKAAVISVGQGGCLEHDG